MNCTVLNNLTPHFLILQILASFTNGSLPNIWQSSSKEINKRIKHAIEVRSSDRMHREHITSLTLVFKDTHIEEKVSWCRKLSGRRKKEFTSQRTSHWLWSLWAALSSSPRWGMKCSTPTWSAPSSCCSFSWLPRPSFLHPGRRKPCSPCL